MFERVHQLQESFRPDETWLQRYLGIHSEVLPLRDLEGTEPKLTLLARELQEIDLLFADERGLLTIIETKLTQNPEARREVVAQVLDYASRLGKMDVLTLCKELSLQGNKEESIREFPKIRDLSKRLFEILQNENLDSQQIARSMFAHYVVTGKIEEPSAFTPIAAAKINREKDFLDRLDQMLKEGSFRLVIVTYEANSQLIDIVNYTNSIMQHGNQLVLVELSRDSVENPTQFVPHLLGTSRRLSPYYYREYKSLERLQREWSKDEFYEELEKNAPDLLDDIQILVSEIEKSESRFVYDFGSGVVKGALQIWLKIPGKETYHLLNVRTDGSVIIYFHPYKTQEKRQWSPEQENWALGVISSRTCLERAKQHIEKSRETTVYHGGEPIVDIRNCAPIRERWRFLLKFMEDFRNALVLSE